ncbi:MAG: hypothetical protein QXM04_01660 [Nanopusillaceae archaeon]
MRLLKLLLILISFIAFIKPINSLNISVHQLYPKTITQNTNISLSICFSENNHVDFLRAWIKVSDSCIEPEVYNIYLFSFSGIYCFPLRISIKNCSSGMYYLYLEGYLRYYNYTRDFSFSYLYPLYIINPPKIILEYNYSDFKWGKINKIDIKIKNYGDPVKDLKINFNSSLCPVISPEIYIENLLDEFLISIPLKVPINISYCTISAILSYKDLLENSYLETKIINLPVNPLISTINIKYDIPTITAGSNEKIILEIYNPTNDQIKDINIFINPSMIIPKKNYIYINNLNPYEKKRIEIEVYALSNSGGEVIVPINISYIDSSGKQNIIYNPIIVKILEKSELKFIISEIEDNIIGIDVINFGNSKIDSLILKINCSSCIIFPNSFYIGSLDVGDSYTIYLNILELNEGKIIITANYLTLYGNEIKKEYEIEIPNINLISNFSFAQRTITNQTIRTRNLIAISNFIYMVVLVIFISLIILIIAWKIFKRIGRG